MKSWATSFAVDDCKVTWKFEVSPSEETFGTKGGFNFLLYTSSQSMPAAKQMTNLYWDLMEFPVHLWTICDFLCHQHHFSDFQFSLSCQKNNEKHIKYTKSTCQWPIVFWSNPWRHSQDSWANQFYLKWIIRTNDQGELEEGRNWL